MIKTSLSLFLLFFTYSASASPHKSLLDLKKPPERKVIVAVIDTGADIHHPALQKSLWKNPQNGLHGWNFIENNSNIQDQHGHGTHIAGIIAQNKNIELMILKAIDIHQSGEAVIESTVKAIQFAIQMGASIINYSGGGTAPHPRERLALEIAQKKGILVVAAAGNLQSNTDQYGFYPANYRLQNIISVAAVDPRGKLTKSSNYGPHSILLAAPGIDVISTLPNNQMGKMSGTSQATARVTRALASLIYKSKNPIQSLLKRGQKSASLEGKIKNPIVIQDEF